MSLFTKNGFWTGLMVLPLLTACNGAADETPAPNADRFTDARPVLEVYKSPTCGCCGRWVAHVDAAFRATVRHPADLDAVKARLGIAPRYRSCHTAVSERGYVFEGHIPVKYIRQFLADPPEDALGLSVPGMPVGSPGMEMGDRFTPYRVLLLKRDGTSTVYATVADADRQYRAERYQ